MERRAVLFVLGNLLLILGACLVAPLLVAVFVDSGSANEQREVLAFAGTSLVSILLGMAGRRAFRDAADRIHVREGFAIVTFSWVLMIAVGTMLYLLAGSTESVADAVFETVSGFTTTGATIFPRPEVLPHGVQFWRHMTQWLGGIGVVVLGVALLPMLGIGGYRLLKAEAPGGVAYERERARITDAAKEIWRLYFGFSIVLFVLLWLGGMTWFDAVCHAFTTMSTGGFSPHTESIAYFPSPFLQWVIILFMIIAGANFSIYPQLLRGRWEQPLRNPEVRTYAMIIAAVVLVGVWLVPAARDLEEHVRGVTFSVVAVITTTGFATVDFDLWPNFVRFALLLLMIVGGCMGSTAGGMKVARIVVYFQDVVRELHRLIYPHAVQHVRIGDRVLDPPVLANILAFGFLYTLTMFVGVAVMTWFDYDLVTSFSAAASAVSNVGPGLGKVGPTQNWAHLPDLAKWVMGFLMLLGRLELFSVLILFTRWEWRR